MPASSVHGWARTSPLRQWPPSSGGADVELVEDQRSGRLDGPLYRVVGVQGVLRDVRQVDAATGALEGIEVRYVADELRPARPFVLRRYEGAGRACGAGPARIPPPGCVG